MMYISTNGFSKMFNYEHMSKINAALSSLNTRMACNSCRCQVLSSNSVFDQTETTEFNCSLVWSQ